jgi:L-ascorbate oxidase
MRCAALLVLLMACKDKETVTPPEADADTDSDSDTDADADADADTDADTDADDCYELSTGECVEETYSDPPVLEPDGDGIYTITIAPTEVTLAGQRHCLRAYNGSYPGPTLDTAARSGSDRSVRINLVNGLLESDYRDLTGDDSCACTDAHGMACEPAGHGSHDEEHGCTCLNDDGDECTEMFDFNLTNLHAHGAHVRPDYSSGGDACVPGKTPSGGTLACRDCGEDDGDDSNNSCFSGDDVITPVQPGDGAQYRYDIDEDGEHYDGLHWFHPHIHGTTGIQVSSGAASAWITRGAIDEVEGMADLTERVMVFTTPPIGEDAFEPLADGVECSEDTITFNNFKTLGSTSAGQLDMLNGTYQPRIVVPPGQVERWRILHAGFLDEVFFGIAKGDDPDCESWSSKDEDMLSLTQYARDGITMPQSYTSDYLFMSPGYRIEALVGGEGVFSDGDTWCLVAARFLQEDSELPIGPLTSPTTDEITDILRNVEGAKLVATINVTADRGEATRTTMPDLDAIAATAPAMSLDGVSADDLCADAAKKNDPDELDQVAILQVGVFTGKDEAIPCQCDNYNINCKNFELTDRSKYPYDRDLPLGEVEHWRVGAAFDGHPFHIHINPFITCPNDNVFDPIPFPHWRDTYLVNLSRRIDLVTQYRAFTGPYVTHCHKLHHEDHGMMQLLRVCDPDEDPTCGDNHWQSCQEGDIPCQQQLAATECAISYGTELEIFACITAEGLPGGECEDTVCWTDDDCFLPGQSCVERVCQ